MQITAMATRLYPWYSPRFLDHTIELRPKHLQLNEVGPNFVEHGRHNHFVHNPEYVFTWLLCVDDNDFEGRGTTLYDQPELPQDNKLHSMIELAAQRYPHTSALHVPFQPNRLLAFVDGPRSMHGTNPFDASLVTGHRRLIQSHVAGPEMSMRAAGSENVSVNLVSEFNEYKNLETVSKYIRDLVEAELHVEKVWHTLQPTSRTEKTLIVHQC